MSSRQSADRRGLPERVKMRHGEHFVETLTTRDDTPIGRQVPLAALEPDPQQPRSAMGDLDDLVGSIRDKGVLEPILVRPNPERGSGARGAKPYLIVCGERRYRAALEAGLFEVPIIELDVTAEEALEIALIENLQRKDLTPFEEAEGYRALGEQHGYTHERIAETVGKSRSAVTETLSLLQMPRRAQDAVLALGISSKSVLLEILKSGSEQEMIQLAERVASLHLSRDDLRRKTRSATRGQSGRRRPYTFSFRAPDKSFQLSLRFRRSSVERGELIETLEQILAELKKAPRTEEA